MDTNIVIVIVCAVCVGAVLGVLAAWLAQRLAEREEA